MFLRAWSAVKIAYRQLVFELTFPVPYLLHLFELVVAETLNCSTWEALVAASVDSNYTFHHQNRQMAVDVEMEWVDSHQSEREVVEENSIEWSECDEMEFESAH